MKLTLSQSIKFGEKTLNEITLREPTIGEVMQAMTHLVEDDHDSFVMSLVASVAVVQLQFVEDMAYPDIKAASDYLSEFPIVPTLDFRGTKVETPFRVLVDPVISNGPKSLDCLEITVPKARMVRDANKALKGEVTLDKVQARNFRLVKEITGVDEVLLRRVPVSIFRKAEEAALSFL